jgi:hypothetical protein
MIDRVRIRSQVDLLLRPLRDLLRDAGAVVDC